MTDRLRSFEAWDFTNGDPASIRSWLDRGMPAADDNAGRCFDCGQTGGWHDEHCPTGNREAGAR